MILLTGASGFLGATLASHFGDRVITVGRGARTGGKPHILADLSDDSAAQKIKKSLQTYDVDTIIHAAGVTPWSDNPDFSNDRAMTQTVCDISNGLGVKVVYFLSGWNVYDMTSGSPPFTEATPLNPDTEYGKSKLMAEEYLAYNLRQGSLINLRLASVYGPGQTSPGLITNLVRDAFSTKCITLNAKQTRRDYLYIDDFVRAVNDLLRQDNLGHLTLNLGSGQSHSVSDIAETIQAIAKKEYGLGVVFRESPTLREAGILDNRLSTQKAQSYGLLQTRVPLTEGLRRYMNWVQA